MLVSNSRAHLQGKPSTYWTPGLASGAVGPNCKYGALALKEQPGVYLDHDTTSDLESGLRHFIDPMIESLPLIPL
jgi:hypothetical protein